MKFIFNILFSFIFLFVGPLKAAPPDFTEQTLENEIGKRIEKVELFKIIKSIADEMNLKVYLFGGTAASYAHYVKTDLMRENGDKRYLPERFDYHYTSIYRSNQDLDIVVDGTVDATQEFASTLKKRFEFIKGAKGNKWEVRSLRNQIGERGDPWYKEALLDDFNFLNQHSVTNSTALIEVTKPDKGEPRIRDLRSWNSKESLFLRDVFLSQIRFLWSDNHFKTSRAKMGLNPPILAAIRLLVKAVQHDLTIDKESLNIIKMIIDDFNPARELSEPQTSRRFEDIAIKLVKNAVNLEYSMNLIEQLGLKQKIIGFYGKKDSKETLSWWLNKKPLPTFVIGTGKGKTAKQLKIKTVAHSTGDYSAYESITRANTGDPNVFISREGVQGEIASIGDGFYTINGPAGSRKGINILFEVNPKAREGTDFTVENMIVIFHNKAALRVIPESLNVTPLEFFTMIGEVKLLYYNPGILEKFSFKIKSQLTTISEQDKIKVQDFIITSLNTNSERSETMIKYYMDLISAEEKQKFVNYLINSNKPTSQATAMKIINSTTYEYLKFDDLSRFDFKSMQKHLVQEQVTAVGLLFFDLYYQSDRSNKKLVEDIFKTTQDLNYFKIEKSFSISKELDHFYNHFLITLAAIDPELAIELQSQLPQKAGKSKKGEIEHAMTKEDFLKTALSDRIFFTYVKTPSDLSKLIPYIYMARDNVKYVSSKDNRDIFEIRLGYIISDFFAQSVSSWKNEDKLLAIDMLKNNFKFLKVSELKEFSGAKGRIVKSCQYYFQ